MKFYISADIEGITGVTHWDETDLDKEEFTSAREQMTTEVVAACEGALQAGATEIWVKDAHDSARNILISRLPHEARLVRGWAPHPYMMMQEMDETFQAAALIGYHSRAGSNTSPLAHTNTGALMRISINGQDASEFRICAYTASMLKVPLVFVSGDKGLCDEVAGINPAITTVAVKQGVGNSTINIHPGLATARIQQGVTSALQGNPAKCYLALPDHFLVEIEYKDHTKAFTNSFYPGAELIGPKTIRFESDRFLEVLRLFFFVC